MIAKPELMKVYAGNADVAHQYPLHVHMCLVPEIDSILNMQGQKKINKLRACQATWTTTKLTMIHTWEIEFLDEFNQTMGFSLHNTMMALKHPSNPRFSLFHSIDKHWKDDCHILTVLKSAESVAHAMIAAMLPYLVWMYEANFRRIATSQIPKWFKLAARSCFQDAYWDPKEECMCNKSDEMLLEAISDFNNLYWESDICGMSPTKMQKGPGR